MLQEVDRDLPVREGHAGESAPFHDSACPPWTDPLLCSGEEHARMHVPLSSQVADCCVSYCTYILPFCEFSSPPREGLQSGTAVSLLASGSLLFLRRLGYLSSPDCPF